MLSVRVGVAFSQSLSAKCECESGLSVSAGIFTLSVRAGIFALSVSDGFFALSVFFVVSVICVVVI